MSNTGRSIVFLVLVYASLVHSPLGAAQPTKNESQTRSATSRTRLDGRFAHYLVSDDGAINGIMLENGTVARFALFGPAPQTLFLRPGDAVAVEGDALSGSTGIVLVNASVELRRDASVPADISPARSVASPSSTPPAHARQARKTAPSQGTTHASQPTAAASKTEQRPDRGRTETGLFLGNGSVSAQRKDYGESFWLKLNHATTGDGRRYIDWHWRRSRETSGQ
jgi:hypothetical protein